jgi:LemA protein
MTKARGRRGSRLFFIFVLLSVPASSQESRRDTPQPLSRQSSGSAEEAAERSLWESIKDSTDPQQYKTFLAKYPQGRFEGEARSRLGALLGEDYVTLFTKRSKLNRQWSNVETQIGRRADVISQLIALLQEAGIQEQELLAQIAGEHSRLLEATSAAPLGEGGDKTPEQKRAVIEADNSFGRTLVRVDPLLENYPQLRSNEGVMAARDRLEGVGNRINVARADYNRAVQEYNDARSLPRMAGPAERHGFTEEPYFKSEQGQPVGPKVNLVSPPSTCACRLVTHPVVGHAAAGGGTAVIYGGRRRVFNGHRHRVRPRLGNEGAHLRNRTILEA